MSGMHGTEGLLPQGLCLLVSPPLMLFVGASCCQILGSKTLACGVVVKWLCAWGAVVAVHALAAHQVARALRC